MSPPSMPPRRHAAAPLRYAMPLPADVVATRLVNARHASAAICHDVTMRHAARVNSVAMPHAIVVSPLCTTHHCRYVMIICRHCHTLLLLALLIFMLPYAYLRLTHSYAYDIRHMAMMLLTMRRHASAPAFLMSLRGVITRYATTVCCRRFRHDTLRYCRAMPYADA